MPPVSAAALICDTGALIDYLVESAPDHGLFRKAVNQARTRYVPGLVLAEVDYFFWNESQGMLLFMHWTCRRMVVALAESLGIRRLAKRDVRHFAAGRLRDGRAFGLVVQPSDPDKS